MLNRLEFLEKPLTYKLVCTSECMRIRTDGDREHRIETIEAAAEFWDCNKTRAVILSADVVPRLIPRLERVLARDDLTVEQKQEIAETLSIPGALSLELEETVTVEADK